jgi:predicted Zn-dependent peptidase
MTADRFRFVERTLDSGLRVLVEEIPASLSAAVGFFVATGSRDERPEIEGVSHFLEHMSFKATKRRSAIEVSQALDRMGSRANAYTSWERTVYYAQILPEFTFEAMALIAEMIDPAFLPEDFAPEKQVILEEIEMYNDRPEFLLFEALMERRFAPHPLAGRILGTRASITGLTLEEMKRYHAARYAPSRLVLAVAGAVSADEVFAAAERLALPSGAEAADFAPMLPAGTGEIKVARPQDARVQFVAAWPGPPRTSLRERYIANIVGILLGDEEGSRLSWTLTHTGIAESIDASGVSFRETGLFTAGWSALPENAGRARELLFAEIRRLAVEPPTGEEFERARTKFAARTMLGSESTMGRMTGLGNEALDELPYFAIHEELDLILSITEAEVAAFAERFTAAPEVVASIGPV